MKKSGVIVLAATVLVCTGDLWGTEQLLWEFSPESVVIREQDYHIGYAELPHLTINENFSLPVQTLYIESEHPLALPDCCVNAEDQDTLGSIPPEYLVFDDRVTSAFEKHIESPQRQLSHLKSAVYDITHFERDGKTIAAVTILPVTLTDGNLLVLNRRVSIVSSGRIVGVHDASGMIEEMGALSARSEYPLAGKSTGGVGVPLGVKYVIITNETLVPAFEELANFRIGLGMIASIALLDSIHQYYPGADDAEKIRHYLAEFHDAGGRYALLGGDDVTVPARYVYFYDTDSPPDDPYYLMPSDLYYADLDGDWDADRDGIWGEPSDDSPGLNPELIIGRLPVRTPEAVQNYISKLIRYMTDPGDGDYAYLSRAMFFSSDQMRDYPAEGQHTVIAEELPASVEVDTTLGVEMPTGGDPNPTNPGGDAGVDRLSEGFGFVHIIAHGRTDGFIVKSANYGDWPASLILTTPQAGGHGSLLELDKNNKSALYYSLACNNGAYDLDTTDGQSGNWSLVETLVSSKDAGAVGMVAYSRWGWVYSSYLLQKSFTDRLYGAAEGSPARAMYYSWVDCPYYRDLIYGQNYFGDPALKIHLTPPEKLEIAVEVLDGYHNIAVTSNNQAVPGAAITLCLGGTVLERGISDESGCYGIATELDDDIGYSIGVVKDGYTAVWETYVPSCVLGVDDNSEPLPLAFSLQQNHPNPFNPVTTIHYTLAKRCDVQFDIYNILGQSVAEFIFTGR
ncbi:MAG: hypothetical protein JSU69_07630, partial [Candidatus Zixiibacteriota bacterium]